MIWVNNCRQKCLRILPARLNHSLRIVLRWSTLLLMLVFSSRVRVGLLSTAALVLGNRYFGLCPFVSQLRGQHLLHGHLLLSAIITIFKCFIFLKWLPICGLHSRLRLRRIFLLTFDFNRRQVPEHLNYRRRVKNYRAAERVDLNAITWNWATYLLPLNYIINRVRFVFHQNERRVHLIWIYLAVFSENFLLSHFILLITLHESLKHANLCFSLLELSFLVIDSSFLLIKLSFFLLNLCFPIVHFCRLDTFQH